MAALLSLVMPAYKQEKTIFKNIQSIQKSLTKLNMDYELIVVVDGKNDNTYKEARKAKSTRVKIITYEKNKGKGFAVKTGVGKARGDIIGFIDAGMDLKPSSITVMIGLMYFHDADIVIGSKLHPDSIVAYPLQRKILSWGYRTLTHYLFNFDVRDTQVGLKLFKKSAAKRIFPKVVVKSFAFDVEVLALATALGYTKIIEAPVKLNFGNSSISSTNFWKVIFQMLKDTGLIFYRLRLTNYYFK